MNEHLSKLATQLYSTTPIFGAGQRRKAVEALVKDGSSGAARHLAEAVVKSEDEQVRLLAVQVLKQISNQDCIDAVCTVWSETGSPELRNLILGNGWMVSSPPELRVKLAFAVGNPELLVEDGPEIVRPLIEACKGECAEQARGLIKTLQNVDTRTELRRLAAEEGVWDALIALIVSEGQWDELWDLTRECPSYWSAGIVREMKDAGWQPSEKEDQETFKQLIKLAKDCTEKPEFWQLMKWTGVKEHSDIICGIKLTPDEKQFVTWSYDGTIGIWNLAERRLEKKLTGHTDRVIALDISPDGSIMASGSSRDDCTVRVWSLPGGEVLKVLEGHGQYVNRVKISGDGKTLVTLDGDGVVRLWSLPDIKEMPALRVGAKIASIETSPDGKILATLDQRKEVRLWSLPGCRDMGAVDVLSQYSNHVYFTPDGRFLVAGLGNNVYTWTMPDGKKDKVFKGHVDSVESLYFSRDGRTFASRGNDMCVRLWNISDGTELTEGKGISCGYNVVFHPSFEFMMTYGARSSVVTEIRTLPDGKLLNKLKALMGRSVMFSPDGLNLVSESSDGTVYFFESELVRLTSTPVANIHIEEFDAVEGLEELQSRLSKPDKSWLEFTEMLVRRAGQRAI